MSYLKCPYCKSENVNVQIVQEKEETGCVAFLITGILAIITFPIGLLFLIIPAITSGSKTKEYAVCQQCGHKWEINK